MDHLEPIVARIVARIPLRAFKQWLSERVDTLSPAIPQPGFDQEDDRKQDPERL
nr:MetaGeneMark_Unknown Function [uncultured bacterium]